MEFSTSQQTFSPVSFTAATFRRLAAGYGEQRTETVLEFELMQLQLPRTSEKCFSSSNLILKMDIIGEVIIITKRGDRPRSRSPGRRGDKVDVLWLGETEVYLGKAVLIEGQRFRNGTRKENIKILLKIVNLAQREVMREMELIATKLKLMMVTSNSNKLENDFQLVASTDGNKAYKTNKGNEDKKKPHNLCIKMHHKRMKLEEPIQIMYNVLYKRNKFI
ncbi:unnamed protein product [Cuscuta epithymum]|uniref:Uncharacterized protein n=2 Tax=Cuscuta epithymum TaxID=186058 RepID=A0AAV0DQ17_9ASTE|nr:unnamed protein product [Cuscuta epithymum]